MTYEDSKPYFYQFRRIKTAWDANAYLSMSGSKMRKEERIAMRFFMARLGCLIKDGKYWQWYEVDPITKAVSTAEIDLEGLIGEKGIIRKPGMEYVPAWDEKWAIKELLWKR